VLKKKHIFAMMLIFLISLVCISANAAEIFTKPADWIKDTNGYIQFKGTFNLPEGTPVSILVAPQILEGATEPKEDVTVQRVQSASNTSQFLSMVDYTSTFAVSQSGYVEMEFYLKDSFPTGFANVLIGYNGGENLINIGSFEHVGKDDVNRLVALFNNNETTATAYPGIIDADIAGSDILRRISANTAGYSALNAKTDFATILYSLKPEGGFTPELLIKSFNQAVAWIELREQADTLAVLKKYNNDVWNMPLAANDDLFILSFEEQSNVLGKVKGGKYSDKAKMLADFLENTAVAIFREVADRDTLIALKDNAKYTLYFAEANNICTNSGLNSYYLIAAYNYVLDYNQNSQSVSDINSLFENAIEHAIKEKEKDNTTDTGSSGGSGGGGGGANVKLPPNADMGPVIQTTPIVTETENKKHPFSDVAQNHWANEYISQMYKNNIVPGISESMFSPDTKISRQDFVKIIVSAMELELSNKESNFTDVEKGSYYEPYVVTAVENGIISGTSESEFGLNNLKREDAAVIISRLLEGKNITGDEEKATEFGDNADISEYARESVLKASECGLFVGDNENRFNPKTELSRAETCALVSRLLAVMAQ